jgi:cytoskeleton protein RodZ
MSEAAYDGVPDVALPVAPTAGGLLREAREAAGLHIAALAVSLKVPVRKLEALESDRLDLLPDAVFARALASSVCRALRVDAAPVLSLLPSNSASLVSPDEAGLNAPFSAPGDVASPGIRAQFSRPAVMGVLILLIGALVILLLPSAQLPSVPSVSSPEPARQPAEPMAALPAPMDGAPANAGVTVFPSDGPAASIPASQEVQPAATAAGSATPMVGSPSVSSLVTFTASGESWIEVIDAKGVVALRRTLQAGESAGATGPLPLAVTVGRADRTRVQVRGQNMDVAPLARDNVARFEVK